ncbi:hypothetical protein HID58_020727 [Brassica napus]|uniref:Uncharacterized protein n=1 Tax=Brassica napus TaxID=3708 RepID=A0ABQ8CUF1_BRANA|nr:hypothetical protein HID58_020727 [Brassica napus]
MSSSASRNLHKMPERGIPQEENIVTSQHEALIEARGEVRDVMLQYTKCADPTEREARMERVRQAEERGQMEEAAIQMVRASLTVNSQNSASKNLTPERPPASQRLGSSAQNPLTTSGKGQVGTSPATLERIPAPLRLGSLQPCQSHSERGGEALLEGSNERVPAPLRLGPSPNATEINRDPADLPTERRKPGRPPDEKRQLWLEDQQLQTK